MLLLRFLQIIPNFHWFLKPKDIWRLVLVCSKIYDLLQTTLIKRSGLFSIPTAKKFKIKSREAITCLHINILDANLNNDLLLFPNLKEVCLLNNCLKHFSIEWLSRWCETEIKINWPKNIESFCIPRYDIIDDSNINYLYCLEDKKINNLPFQKDSIIIENNCYEANSIQGCNLYLNHLSFNMCTMTNLKYLTLSGTFLFSKLNHYTLPPNLESLYIGYYYGELIPYLTFPNKLKHLSIMTLNIPLNLKHLDKLQSLFLGDIHPQTKFPDYLKDLSFRIEYKGLEEYSNDYFPKNLQNITISTPGSQKKFILPNNLNSITFYGIVNENFVIPDSVKKLIIHSECFKAKLPLYLKSLDIQNHNDFFQNEDCIFCKPLSLPPFLEKLKYCEVSPNIAIYPSTLKKIYAWDINSVPDHLKSIAKIHSYPFMMIQKRKSQTL